MQDSNEYDKADYKAVPNNNTTTPSALRRGRSVLLEKRLVVWYNNSKQKISHPKCRISHPISQNVLITDTISCII